MPCLSVTPLPGSQHASSNSLLLSFNSVDITKLPTSLLLGDFNVVLLMLSRGLPPAMTTLALLKGRSVAMKSLVLLSVELDDREQTTWKEAGADTRGGLGGSVTTQSCAEWKRNCDLLTGLLCAPCAMLLWCGRGAVRGSDRRGVFMGEEGWLGDRGGGVCAALDREFSTRTIGPAALVGCGPLRAAVKLLLVKTVEGLLRRMVTPGVSWACLSR